MKVIAVVGAIALVILASLWFRGDEPSELASAIELADDQDRYSSTDDAVDAFARIAELVRVEARRCADDRAPSDRECQRLAQAFAVAQTVAVRALDCTAPGIFELRTTLLAYLDSVDDDEDGTELPRVPELGRCPR